MRASVCRAALRALLGRATSASSVAPPHSATPLLKGLLAVLSGDVNLPEEYGYDWEHQPFPDVYGEFPVPEQPQIQELPEGEEMVSRLFSQLVNVQR